MPAEPTLTADQVGAHLEAFAASDFLDPHEAMDAYLGLMGHGDGRCPDDPQQLTDTVVYGCETDDGWFYMGVSHYLDVLVGRDPHRELGGDFLIVSPDGEEFEWGGGTAVTRHQLYGVTHMIHMGTVRSDLHDGWMRFGSAVFEAERLGYGAVLRVQGGVQIGEDVVDLEGVEWDARVCDGQPTGVVSWRGPDQRWYDVELDCGCGDVVFEGQELGEGCVDLGPLADHIHETMQWSW